MVPAHAAAGERNPGVEVLIRQILIPTAVELVGSGACRWVEHAAQNLAKFGGETAALQRELLHRLHRWHCDVGSLLDEGAGGVLALQDDLEGLVGKPVHADLLVALLLVNGSGNQRDRKSTRLNSSHLGISYAVFCLKKKN